ncbi:MAG: FKBP12-associated protein [Piccolia ochrophora]|nr:MAG: FKBP12-associated protein [Piccolia ochrophora]
MCHAPYSCPERNACSHKILITCECQHLKQELRCNATKSNAGNASKSLKCSDECARLERNHRLALALDIDPATHTDDHIPYSKETLSLYAAHRAFAHPHERTFRVFAADDTEKRIRFKPMPASHRAFIRSLATDFGLDSESLDPEPNRHVLVLKTPRFVAAPMKTLAQCEDISARTQAISLQTTSRRAEPSTTTNNFPFNALLLTSPRFGLTISELRTAISSTISTPTSNPPFDISFLPSEEVVLVPKPPPNTSDSSSTTIESLLRTMLPTVTARINTARIASSAQLCRVDASLNVVRRERGGGRDAADGGTATDSGWSKVAAKAAAPPRSVKRDEGVVGGRSVFTVLGGRGAKVGKEKEKKREEDVIVDDWEKAEEEAEMMEEEPSMQGDGVTLQSIV